MAKSGSSGAMWGWIIVMALVLSQDHVVVDAAVSCSQAVSKLMPCLPYLKDAGGITAPCCQGVQSLDSLASSKPDRQSVCECLKQAAESLSVDISRAKQIPQLCNVKLAIPVDPNANCANA